MARKQKYIVMFWKSGTAILYKTKGKKKYGHPPAPMLVELASTSNGDLEVWDEKSK